MKFYCIILILVFTGTNVSADYLMCAFLPGIEKFATDNNTVGQKSIGLGDATWNRLNVQNLKNYKNMSKQDIQTWYNERIVPKDPSEDDPRDYYVVKQRLKSTEGIDAKYSKSFLKREREQLEFGNKFEFGPIGGEEFLLSVFFEYQNERLIDILKVHLLVKGIVQEGDFYNFWATRDINDLIVSNNNKSISKINAIMDNGYNIGLYIDYNKLAKFGKHENIENAIKFFWANDQVVQGFNSDCGFISSMPNF